MSTTDRNDARIGITHNRALCCECGELRLVAKGYGFSHRVGEGNSPARLAELAECAHAARYAHIEPWHRLLGDLKCVNCGASTRHAILRDCDDAESRDYAETGEPTMSTFMDRVIRRMSES